MEQQNNKSKWIKPAYQVVAERLGSFISNAGFAQLKQVQERAKLIVNISTDKKYSELNGLLLALDAVNNGYESNVYGTLKQMNYAKRIIKSGEKATLILMLEGKDNVKSAILRSMFNLDQTEAKQQQAS